jgi:hypothetical protein
LQFIVKHVSITPLLKHFVCKCNMSQVSLVSIVIMILTGRSVGLNPGKGTP